MQSYPERLISRYLLLRQTIRKRWGGRRRRSSPSPCLRELEPGVAADFLRIASPGLQAVGDWHPVCREFLSKPSSALLLHLGVASCNRLPYNLRHVTQPTPYHRRIVRVPSQL